MDAIILIVDDEPALLKAYGRKFRQRQDIRYAESGAEALAVVQSGQQVSVLLTDLNMPGIDGLTLLQTVRSLSPDTKRYLMTGAPQEDRVQEALRAGAIDFCLSKPFPAAELSELLQDLDLASP